MRVAIHTGKVAGVVLFEADFPSRAAGRELIEGLQAIPRPAKLRRFPLLVMTDQEGGQVKRVGGAPEASAATMGAEGAGFARREGRATAANLRSLGVNVDLAPVLDVARPGGVIADTERGFGSTPGQVAATAVSFATGLQNGGVAATAKQFQALGFDSTPSFTGGTTGGTLKPIDLSSDPNGAIALDRLQLCSADAAAMTARLRATSVALIMIVLSENWLEVGSEPGGMFRTRPGGGQWSLE